MLQKIPDVTIKLLFSVVCKFLSDLMKSESRTSGPAGLLKKIIHLWMYSKLCLKFFNVPLLYCE